MRLGVISVSLPDVVASCFIHVLPLSHMMTRASSPSFPMNIVFPKLPIQALQCGLHVKDPTISQVSLVMMTKVLLLVDHLPLKLGGLRAMVSSVVSLRCVFVCFSTTKCISESGGASLGSSFSCIGAYAHFGPRAGCAVVLLRDPCQEIGCAPAGCFLLCLLVRVLSVCVLGTGYHVGASVRVTVCRELV